jgi:hypothetical protein
MAPAFGFSIGDFITSINLVKDIIKALNDSKGSSKEYLEVILELRNLEGSLVLVKAQYNDILQTGLRNALCQAVKDCEDCITNFLESLQKYHGHLSTKGTKNRWKDAIRKIQWHLCQADDLTTFRVQIASHVRNVEMLLATIQTWVHQRIVACKCLLTSIQICIDLIKSIIPGLFTGAEESEGYNGGYGRLFEHDFSIM